MSLFVEAITYMYVRYFVITCISLWKRGDKFSFEQTLIPCTQECCVSSLVEIGPVVLEKKNLNPLHPKILWAKLVWNWPKGAWEDFLIREYIHYYIIIFPWKRTRPFIWTNLLPLYPRMLCAKFGRNRSIGSRERRWQCKKVYWETDGLTDRPKDGRTTEELLIRKGNLSFQLRWA